MWKRRKVGACQCRQRISKEILVRKSVTLVMNGPILALNMTMPVMPATMNTSKSAMNAECHVGDEYSNF